MNKWRYLKMLTHSDNYSFAAIDRLQLYSLSTLKLECIIHVGKRTVYWRRKSVVIVQMMQSVDACTGKLESYNSHTSHNDYSGVTCLNHNVVEKMILIYELMVNEALLRRITFSKTQNQNDLGMLSTNCIQ